MRGLGDRRHLFNYLFLKTFTINLIFIVIVTFSVCLALSKYMLDQAAEYSKGTARLINQQLDMMFRSVDDIERAVIADQSLRIALTVRQALPDYPDPVIDDIFATARDKLVSMMLLLDDYNYCMLDNEGHLPERIYTTQEILNANFKTKNEGWYAEVVESPNRFHIVYDSPCDFYISAERSISFIRAILNLRTDKPNAFIVVNLPYSDLTSALQRQVGTRLPIQILDPRGRIIYSTGGSDPQGRSGGGAYEDTSSYTGITVKALGGMSPTLGGLGRLIAIVLAMMCLYVLATLVVTFLSLKGVTRPIYNLIDEMKPVGAGNFDARVLYDGRIVEIHDLIDSYNSLIERIRSLVKTNYEQKTLMMQAELKALQDEINPHFLYNTLETISSQAILDGSKTASLMCQKLGAMFSFMLDGPDLVTIERELGQVRDYAYIATQCVYYSHIELRCGVDPALDSQSIPKLTLQPLVENCFKHAFKGNFGEDRLIEVKAVAEGSVARIEVADNGAGMSRERIESLYAEMRDSSRGGNSAARGMSGLINVNNRLSFYFGAEYSMELISDGRRGSAVVLRLPKVALDRR
jgi:Predicted signal transduction protein with a C-terminal ATPase domain